MLGPINYLKGQVRVRIVCGYQERFINLCAREGVAFRELRREGDDTWEMTVDIGSYRRLRDISKSSGVFTVKIVSRRGAPFLLWRIRKRYALLLGAGLCVGAVWLSSFFIWQIDVSGNETVPTWRILSCLKELGVEIGASTFSISQARLSNEMLLMIPELSWITMNTKGSRLEVLVREETQPPDILDDSVPMDVRASRTGIITKIQADSGEKAVLEGEAVDRGDLLISGSVTGYGGERLVRASGQVWAKTMREMTLEMPSQMEVKRYTGASTTRYALIIGGKRVNLYFSGGNPYDCCDKITLYDTVTLGDAVMPVTLVRETYEEYEKQLVYIETDTAERILSARLMWLLQNELGQGSVDETEFTTVLENGKIKVTLTAQCTELIGIETPIGSVEGS